MMTYVESLQQPVGQSSTTGASTLGLPITQPWSGEFCLHQSPNRRSKGAGSDATGVQADIGALIDECDDAIGRGLTAAGYTQRFVDYEDAKQEALAAIVAGFPTATPPDRPCGWMHTVTRNSAIGRTRSKAARQRGAERLRNVTGLTDVTTQDQYPAEQLDVKALAELVIGTLPPDYRDMVVGYYFDELSVKELAKRNYVAEDTVYTRLRRARVAMLQVLKEHGHA